MWEGEWFIKSLQIKMKTSLKNKQNLKFRTKISANKVDKSDSAQDVFTVSLCSNYTNEIPNQPISSIESEHVTKTRTYQPIENEWKYELNSIKVQIHNNKWDAYKVLNRHWKFNRHHR